MSRRPDIGNVRLYPDRPLTANDAAGYVLQFYCPIRGERVRRSSGTRDRREARQILRECRERLLNGKYIESNGAITLALEQANVRNQVANVLAPSTGMTWQQCVDAYYKHRKQRGRANSLVHATSRIEIVGRILEVERTARGLPNDGPIKEYASLLNLEYLQERLLAGDEGRYESRAAMSVNSIMAAIMAFFRFCKRHQWIDEVPPLAKLEVDQVMKGRPVTADEFEKMLTVIPKVVGEHLAASWKFVLQILWESAFRVGDVMNFSWDDERKIHPVWPNRNEQFPTLLIPSSQKNKKAQEIPMLPGLQILLETVPSPNRTGWVVNPLPLGHQKKIRENGFKPTSEDLAKLVQQHSNSSIAKACGVTETAVRKWLKLAGISANKSERQNSGKIPAQVVAQIRARTEAVFTHPSPSIECRLSIDHVSRIIASIGEKARIIVQQPNEETGRRIKYASAHDLRRGCAHRLINAGVSAETLKVVLRHEDFKTTERFYGAVREAQSAAAEVHQKLSNLAKMASNESRSEAATEKLLELSPEELRKLKALLNAL